MSQSKFFSLRAGIFLVFISALLELVFLRWGLKVDLLLSSLIVISLLGLFEAILVGGVLGYLILFGPFFKIELIYLLIVPFILGYFGRRLFSPNIITLCGLTVLGMLLFYALIDVGTVFGYFRIWWLNMALSLGWVAGLYSYWSLRYS